MSLVAILLAIASLAPEPAQVPDVVGKAREFLEAFSKNPLTAKRLVTDDALIVVGDIGGPYAEFVSDVPPDMAAKFQTCRAGMLAMKPIDPSMSVDEMFGTGRDRRRTAGNISMVEGQYLCSRVDGSSVDSKVVVVFEGDRVALLALWGAN